MDVFCFLIGVFMFSIYPLPYFTAEPPSYNDLTPTKIPLWPGEAFSTTTISDSEGKNTPQTTPTKKPMLSPNKLNIMNSSPSPRSPLSVKGKLMVWGVKCVLRQ